MMKIRRSHERGHANHGWLDTFHTFSFAHYYDPDHVGFRTLRVINDDTVAPGQGFGTHGHRDMEIVTYVLEGGLEHKDSMGTGSVLRPGDVQRMSAGTGVTHSEFNHSAGAPLHFLQIWILPERSGLTPDYEEKRFDARDKRGQLRLIVSPDGRDGSLRIHQDARIYAAMLGSGENVQHQLADGRHAWLQMARGEVRVNGVALGRGDGLAISDEARLDISGVDDAELLLFDLA
jgi:redox-sensitive bicupin YhaK (pirin superfamily)